MKLVLSSFILLTSLTWTRLENAQAAIQTKVGTTQSIIKISDEAKDKDTDASRLFAAMNTTAIDKNQTYNKHLSFKDAEGVPLFDLTCDIAKATRRNECTMTIYKTENTEMTPTENSFIFMSKGPDAWNITRNFNQNKTTAPIYLSKDESLAVLNDPSPPEEESLRIWYLKK